MESWSEEARVVTRVALYTPAWVITGNLRMVAPVRLSDLLNNWSEAFFPLDEARTLSLEDGRAEAGLLPTTLLVALTEILMLHEVPSPEAASRPGAVEMHVPKQPTPIMAYIGPLRVEGNLYLPAGADMAAYIGHAVGTFLPLTSVTIVLPEHGRLGMVRVPFALINRHRSVIGRLEKGPPPPEALA